MRESDEAAVPPEPKRPALHYAGYLLGLREWSAKELELRLKQKGYPAADIARCLEFLMEKGLQDDARYAAVRARSRGQTRGNRRLKQELAAKGITSELAAQTLATLDDETDRAQAAAARFSGKEMTVEQRAKVWRYLTSRGFGGDAIKAAVRVLQAEASNETPEA